MSSPIRYVVAICITVLFAGCESGWIKASKMNKLSLGMTRAEVVKVLGEPHSTEARDGQEILWYLEDQGNWVHQPYFTRFESGQLKAYGPANQLQ